MNVRENAKRKFYVYAEKKGGRGGDEFLLTLQFIDLVMKMNFLGEYTEYVHRFGLHHQVTPVDTFYE